MGKNGIFVMLLVTVMALALQPSLVNYSYAGTVVPAEICDDGIDNNGNGLIDLDDPQCSPIILKPTPGALPELPGFDPDPIPLVGDFKCYEAVASHLEEIALLQDQFQDKQYRIQDIERVCNYIIKSASADFPGSTEPEFPLQHYKVYNIVDNEFEDDVLLKDQWGVTRHTHLTPTELWVPQTKIHNNPVCANPSQIPSTFDLETGMCVWDVPQPGLAQICTAFGGNPLPGDLCEFPPTNPQGIIPQETEIHWKCYDVPPKIPDTPFQVGIFDPNFDDGHQNLVLQLDKICAPVKKSVCMPGYAFTPEGQCFDTTGSPTNDFTPIMFGDNTIPDHLTCYDIEENVIDSHLSLKVTYAGQFQEDLFDIRTETEICLFATKLHVPEIPDDGPGGTPVGGSFIPIDSSALLLLAAQTTASWIIPVLVSAVGIGIVLARKISSNKE